MNAPQIYTMMKKSFREKKNASKIYLPPVRSFEFLLKIF